MNYAPLIKQVVDEAKGEISLSQLFSRVIELSKSVPSFEELNSGLSQLGREPASAEAYAKALIDFAPVVIREQKRMTKTVQGRLLLGIVGAALPLAIYGVALLSEGNYLFSAVALGLVFLLMFAALFPRSGLLTLLFSNIGLRQRPSEKLSHYQLKIGILIVGMGALFIASGIWGRSALYASGVGRGDQPVLEIILMIPMPLIGVTLVLWGLGKFFKGIFGAAFARKIELGSPEVGPQPSTNMDAEVLSSQRDSLRFCKQCDQETPAAERKCIWCDAVSS